MATESGRSLAWEILRNVKQKLRNATDEKVDSLKRETEERETKRHERGWWLPR